MFGSLAGHLLAHVVSPKDYGLQLFSSTTGSLIAYSDADRVGCLTTRRSTSRCELGEKKRKRDEVEAEYEGVDVDKGEDEGVKVKIREKRKGVGKGDEELLVAKEGFDDEEKLLRTVFVGNLPLKVKKKALFREFAKFGEVESVRIRSIPLLDVSVFGFV
nr:RNA-binding protein 34 [Tanacetum cinerariifolium]